MAGGLDVMRVARGERVGEGWLGEVRAVAMAVWGIAACRGSRKWKEWRVSFKRLMSVMNETDPPNQDVVKAFES